MTPLETYLTKLCALQKDLIESYNKYIHATNRPTSLHDASEREWSLSSQCLYLKKDNDALRELAEEYKAIARGAGQKIAKETE